MSRFDFIKNIRLPDFRRLFSRVRLSRGRLIWWGAGLLVGIGVFLAGRFATACWQITDLPGIPPASCKVTAVNPLGTPVVSEPGAPTLEGLPPTPIPAELLPPAWDGASRINILFIGLDYRDWVANEGPPRSDTMILFTVDPLSKTAGMLSIPRDMWVNIPAFGYSRINTAYSSGEGSGLPGGGPGLAMKTVEQFIGVPVHYYAQIDFTTFTDLIDFLGGVEVYVDQDLVLDLVGPGYDPIGRLNPGETVTILGKNANGQWVQIAYPAGPNGKAWILASAFPDNVSYNLPVVRDKGQDLTAEPFAGVTAVVDHRIDVRDVPGDPNHIKVNCCGYRLMDGDRALAYARTRKTEGGDADRARRQQAVIQAIQRKVFDPASFPSLILSAPQIYSRFQAGIHTNMPLDDAIRLAVLGRDISFDAIKKGVIDVGDGMGAFANTTLGGEPASVVRPYTDKIRILRDEIFTTSGPLSPFAAGDPASLMRSEEARVRVLAPDGTRAGQFFASQGMSVTEAGPGGGEAQTVVVMYGPRLYTWRWLQSTFGFTHSHLRFSPDPAQSVDIEIRVGYDIWGRIP